MCVCYNKGVGCESCVQSIHPHPSCVSFRINTVSGTRSRSSARRRSNRGCVVVVAGHPRLPPLLCIRGGACERVCVAAKGANVKAVFWCVLLLINPGWSEHDHVVRNLIKGDHRERESGRHRGASKVDSVFRHQHRSLTGNEEGGAGEGEHTSQPQSNVTPTALESNKNLSQRHYTPLMRPHSPCTITHAPPTRRPLR